VRLNAESGGFTSGATTFNRAAGQWFQTMMFLEPRIGRQYTLKAKSRLDGTPPNIQPSFVEPSEGSKKFGGLDLILPE
jgi:hypothetical protein